jgi:hypothetical protein
LRSEAALLTHFAHGGDDVVDDSAGTAVAIGSEADAFEDVSILIAEYDGGFRAADIDSKVVSQTSPLLDARRLSPRRSLLLPFL